MTSPPITSQAQDPDTQAGIAMKRAVVFGAGSIGRGFIGASLSLSGWHVTLIDVAAGLVAKLHEQGSFRQVIAQPGKERVNICRNIAALRLSDEAAVQSALHEADLVATAVGVENLADIAAILSNALPGRAANGRDSMDVLLCENHPRAHELMRHHLTELGEGAEAIGLARVSVGRIVPISVPDPADPTQVVVEAYDVLHYDAEALLGEPPSVNGFEPIWEGFTGHLDRKLYVFNMGHCMSAYLGALQHYEYIWQATDDVHIRYLVRGAMVEAAIAIGALHGFPTPEMLTYVDDLLARFGNRALGDTCSRVGRDPWRKMQPDDRILGAYGACLRTGIHPNFLGISVALGAWQLGQQSFSRSQVADYLRSNMIAWHSESRQRQLIWEAWHLLEQGTDPRGLLALLDHHIKEPPHIT